MLGVVFVCGVNYSSSVGENYLCVCLCACTTTTVSVPASVQDAYICDEAISRFVFCGDEMNCDRGP